MSDAVYIDLSSGEELPAWVKPPNPPDDVAVPAYRDEAKVPKFMAAPSIEEIDPIVEKKTWRKGRKESRPTKRESPSLTPAPVPAKKERKLFNDKTNTSQFSNELSLAYESDPEVPEDVDIEPLNPDASTIASEFATDDDKFVSQFSLVMKRAARFARHEAETEAQFEDMSPEQLSTRAKALFGTLLLHPSRIAQQFFKAYGDEGKDDSRHLRRRTVQDILNGERL